MRIRKMPKTTVYSQKREPTMDFQKIAFGLVFCMFAARGAKTAFRGFPENRIWTCFFVCLGRLAGRENQLFVIRFCPSPQTLLYAAQMRFPAKYHFREIGNCVRPDGPKRCYFHSRCDFPEIRFRGAKITEMSKYHWFGWRLLRTRNPKKISKEIQSCILNRRRCRSSD